MITMLKKTSEKKKNIWTRHKNEGRKCGTHNRARLQIKWNSKLERCYWVTFFLNILEILPTLRDLAACQSLEEQ